MILCSLKSSTFSIVVNFDEHLFPKYEALEDGNVTELEQFYLDKLFEINEDMPRPCRTGKFFSVIIVKVINIFKAGFVLL